MKSKYPLSWLYSLISVCCLLVYQPTAQAAPELTIGNYQLVSSKRITRTVYEYTYKASVTNTGNDAVAVSAELSINAPGVTAIDGKLEFSDVPTGKTIVSSDTFAIRHDRNYSFKVNALQWVIDATPAALLINKVTPSSGLPGTQVAIALQGIINDGVDLVLSLGGRSLPYAFREGSETIIEFTVPANIQSASLFVSQNDQQSNGVWFDVNSNAVRIPAPSEIALDELGNKVAINLVLVSFHQNDYTLAEAQRVANSVGAEITAALTLVDGYQFKLQTTNLEELQQVITILESDPAVDFVVTETHIPSNQVPTLWNIGYIDDPRPLQRYLNRVEQGATKYRANVDPAEVGKHRPTRIKIGVAELGVDFDDNDFKKYAGNNAGNSNITIDAFDLPFSNDSKSNHGTVVTGMIAAGLYDDVIQPNIDFNKCIGGCNAGFLQGLGLSHAGFDIRVHQVGLHDAVIDSLQQMFWSSSMYSEATENLLNWGANVINWSFGVQEESQSTCWGGTVSSDDKVSNRVFNNNKRLFAKLLTTIKSKYPKVIIVSAAGNGFTPTNENTVIPSGIQNDSMIVVGAHLSVEGISSMRPKCTSLSLENAEGLQEGQTKIMPLRSGYSNYGSQVHISAVGEVIDSYGTLKGGTSFAAPLVSATVAAMKSIKPDLTAVEARHILRKYALPMYPKVEISPAITEDVTTALLSMSNGEVREDGHCYSDPTLWCEGMGARLNVEGAIQGVLDSLTPTNSPTTKLNDTGIVTCSNATTNGLACPVTNFPGQDAQYGRDAQALAGTLQKVGGGNAGFDFTKLDSNGNPLPANASAWQCVKDNVTGLIWEVKTDDGGLRDKDNTYSWYEPDNSKNGGNAGTQNGGSCNGSSCDTRGYIQSVNSQGLCGSSNWRMPNRNELLSIVDNSRFGPAIDINYFPNSPASGVLSSSPEPFFLDRVWGVHFGNGVVGHYIKDGYSHVRLVRGGH